MDGVIQCAWCSEPIEESPTPIHRAQYHWRCAKDRGAALRWHAQIVCEWAREARSRATATLGRVR